MIFKIPTSYIPPSLKSLIYRVPCMKFLDSSLVKLMIDFSVTTLYVKELQNKVDLVLSIFENIT